MITAARLFTVAGCRFTVVALVGVLVFGALAEAGAQAPGLKGQKKGRTVLSAELVAGLEAKEGITYARYGEREMALDLYRPRNVEGALPAVVCIHGGGWQKGMRSTHGNLAKALAARGYVAVTISYRLSGEAMFPAATYDCKAAVRWLRANAKEYGVDPERIGAAGLSAGGHLVALLATSGGVAELEGKGGNAAQSSLIQAAVAMGAQSDFMSERNRKKSAEAEIWQKFLGGSQEEQPERYRLASPLAHLDASDPPVLFMSGELDDPSTHAEEFRAKAKKLGLATGYTAIPGAPHGFMGGRDHFDFCVEKTAEFFGEHLK